MSFTRKNWLTIAALFAGMFWCGSAGATENLYWHSKWWSLYEGVSSYSKDIDALFYGILALTGVVFVGTELCLIWFIIAYRRKEGVKSHYTHGNHTLEMVWTITPAITLIVIALVQARTWNDIKDPSHFPTHEANKEALHVHLIARQFSWWFRYPNEKGQFNTKDCVQNERTLYVPENTPVIMEMTSMDVIHSFFLPYMRLKQDVVPGMHIKCWFDSNITTDEMRKIHPKLTMINPMGKPEEKEWDFPIVCAELCGIQHYQMWGRVKVLSKPAFAEWLKKERTSWGNEEHDEYDDFAKYWKVDAKGNRVYGGENARTSLKAEPAHGHGHEEKKSDEKKPDEKASEKAAEKPAEKKDEHK